MLTFRGFMAEDRDQGVEYHVFSPPKPQFIHNGGWSPHHVVAYHKDADSSFHRDQTSLDDYLHDGTSGRHNTIQHPTGMTSRNVVGYARFVEHPYKNHYYASRVDVHTPWRRKGIATKMYDAFTQHTGYEPKPSEDQSVDGQSFWKKKRLSESEDHEVGYHVTPRRNVKKILSQGLVPKLGKRSKEIGEREPAVHLFKSRDEAEDGTMNWLGDQFSEETPLSLLKVHIPHDAKRLPTTAEYEHRIATPIHPKHISVDTHDF